MKFLKEADCNNFDKNIFPFFNIILLTLPLLFFNPFAYTNYFLIIILYVICILTPVFFLNKSLERNHSLLDISFWVYVYIFLGFAGIIQLNTNQIPWVNNFPINEIFKVIGMIFLGIVGFIFGRYQGYSFKIPRRFISVKRIDFLFLVSIFLAILLFYLIGFEKIIFPRLLFDLTIKEASYLEMLLIRFLKVSFFVCLISYLIQITNNQISYSRLIFISFFMLVYFNPIRSERLSFLMFVSFLALYFFNFNKKFWMSSLSLGLAFVFPYLDYFRESLTADSFSKKTSYDVTQHFITGDFDALSTIYFSIKYVSFNGYLFFSNFFNSLIVYIPRSIWPDKPISSSFALTDDSNIQFSSIATNYWAEGYLALGGIGVFLSLYFLGLSINSFLIKKNQSHFSEIIYIFFIPYMIYFLRGDLYSISFRLLPLIAFTFFVTKKKN